MLSVVKTPVWDFLSLATAKDASTYTLTVSTPVYARMRSMVAVLASVAIPCTFRTVLVLQFTDSVLD